MTTDAAELVIAGTGSIYVAPYSTSLTLPDEPDDALGADWVNLGYTTEDGVTLSLERDAQSVMAWQKKRAVRRFNASQMERLTFTLEQWNEQTLVFAFGGGSVTVTSGSNYKFAFPDPDTVDERACIVDWVDGDKNFRLVIPKGSVIDTTETTLTRTAASLLPVTFEAVDLDPYILTDDDNFSAIS